MEYLTGHAKRNPVTGDIAIRTIFDAETFPDMVWLIATTGSGCKTSASDPVESWDDLV